MIELRTDNQKMAARYYHLHACLYEQALRRVSRILEDNFEWGHPDYITTSLIVKDICEDLDHALSNKSIIKQVCKEFGIKENNSDATSHL